MAGERAEEFFAALGKHVEWVGDAPGLVLGRIVCQLVNEAAFALGEGVGSADDIDAGMLLGLNYPHGPLDWADAIGLDHVLTVLDGLADEYREERYRAAPGLRRAGLGRAAGAPHGRRILRALALEISRSARARRSIPVSLPPFQRLLDDHGRDVLRFLVAAAGPDEADDCFQETFLAALRAYPSSPTRPTSAVGC